MTVSMHRRSASLKVAILIASAILAGCVAIPWQEWVAVPTDQANIPRDSERLIAAKDKVRARYKSTGKTYAFTVESVTAEEFIGIGEDRKRYRVKFANLSFLEVRRTDWKFYGGGGGLPHF